VSDGVTSTKAEPKHRYPGPGNYTTSVLMRSINGAVAKGSTTVEVPQPDPDC
jgi:PKD repeat protein